jgi:hypothetical protein
MQVSSLVQLKGGGGMLGACTSCFQPLNACMQSMPTIRAHTAMAYVPSSLALSAASARQPDLLLLA